MSWNKIWLGTTSTDFAVATNWQKISLRNPSFNWTQKGATGEYYVRATGPADPAFGAKPGAVYINGALATEGSLGSLSVGQWVWGDPDTLGYNTVTVKVAGSVDPDTLARDYIQFQAVPNGADSIAISGLATNGIESNTDQSSLTGPVTIEAGFQNKPLGTQLQPLRLTPSSLLIMGSGQSSWYLDIGSAAIAVEIRNAPAAISGRYGLYLTGSAMTNVFVTAGSVAIAMLPGDTSAVALLQTLGGQASVILGSGVTLGDARSLAGTITVQCDADLLDCQGGQIITELGCEATEVTIDAGTLTDKSIGTHDDVTLDGGTLDTLQLGGAKTYTAFQYNAGTFKENVDLLTVTTRTESAYAGVVSRQRAA